MSTCGRNDRRDANTTAPPPRAARPSQSTGQGIKGCGAAHARRRRASRSGRPSSRCHGCRPGRLFVARCRRAVCSRAGTVAERNEQHGIGFPRSPGAMDGGGRSPRRRGWEGGADRLRRGRCGARDEGQRRRRRGGRRHAPASSGATSTAVKFRQESGGVGGGSDGVGVESDVGRYWGGRVGARGRSWDGRGMALERERYEAGAGGRWSWGGRGIEFGLPIMGRARGKASGRVHEG
jgi:hypothetical protein